MYDPYFDSFGLPLTVLCQTTGKLVLLAKFWVTAARLGSARKALHAGASPLRKDFAGFASWFVWLSHV